MSYNYKSQKANIFTERGSEMFTKIRDRSKKLLEDAGSFRMQEVWKGCGGGDSWDMLACVDRLVEMGEIVEITKGNVAAQYRVFVKAN